MEKFGDLTVLNFVLECNEFLEGKYLFASQKLEAIYKSVLDSPALVELFLQCSEDFKYSLEMTKAFIKTPTKPGTFTPPTEPDKFLALVFGLLKEIIENTINFNVFVPKYFSEDAKVPPTQAFANKIVLPLKVTVAKYFEVDAENKKRFSLEEITAQQQEIEEEKQKMEKEESQISIEEIEQTTVLQNQTSLQNEKQKETEVVSALEDDMKTYKVTYEDLMEALNLALKELQSLVKAKERLNANIKADLLFAISRGLRFAKANDMEGLYSELTTIKYMKWKLFFARKNIKEIFEIFEYFEKL